MTDKRPHKKQESDLRRRAEKSLKGKAARIPKKGEMPGPGDVFRLYNELQVHQIELVMQNEELRRTQRELEASRERYFDLYDLAPVGYVTLNETGFVLEANLTAADMLGLLRSDIVHQPLTRFIHPEDQDIYYHSHRALPETRTLQVCEVRFLRQGKSPFWCQLEVTISEDAHGTPVYRAVMSNVTGRREMEEMLRESEELFRLTFDRSPIGAAMVDVDQRIIRANGEFCRMLGYSQEEIIGMALQDITHPEDIQAELDNLRIMLTGGMDHFTMEKRYICRDGSMVWGQLTAGVIRDSRGRPKFAVRMVEDITSRKQAERYHHLTAEILRTLNSSSSMEDSINLILDAIARETGCEAAGIRLRQGNDFPYFVQKGFPRDFILRENTLMTGDTDNGLCRDKKDDISLECMCDLVISGHTDPANPLFTEGGSCWTNNALQSSALPAEEESRLCARNNCVHQGYLSVALIPIPANQEIVGLLQLNDRRKNRFTLEVIKLFEGIAVSIGAALIRKRTEKVLAERTAQLEEANRELESFSYSVSHDLRAPLRAIDGFSRIILKKQDNLDKDIQRQLNLIRDNARMMSTLIEDLLAFSRTQRASLKSTAIDMAELVRAIWDDLMEVNRERTLELQVTEILPAYGDPALVRQVLFNLISNAVKFTKNRKPGIVKISSYPEADKIVYSIKDNGAGFSMEYYHKLFGVFQRLHSDAEFEGTGIGLAIVQCIVKRHGGEAWAEGEPDKGATFYFSLPSVP